VELHFSLQYFTDSQLRAHFFRQLKGRLQLIQIFDGRYDLLPFAAPIDSSW
jgi:hypothetical protein